MWFSLLLIVLLAMSAFAVDVGAWYSRASEIQKAADAAALAGVGRMPDVSKAKAAAEQTAKLNGFVDGQDDIGITYTPLPPRQYRVDIVDKKVKRYFSQVVSQDQMTIKRGGTAEYALPVPLGSPDNHFGNDPTAAGTQPNFWAAIQGTFTDKEQGDPYATKCTNVNPWTLKTCNSENPEYRPSGYLYAIKVPSSSKDLKVQIYDAGFYNRDPSVETGDSLGDVQYLGVNTHFELYKPDDTPLDNTDNPTLATAGGCQAGPGKFDIPREQDASLYKNQWATLCQINGMVLEGTYLLRVWSTNVVGAIDYEYGSNSYSIRATTSQNPQPEVYGIGDMSIYANINAGDTEFYLAEVDQVYAGKTLEIRLFDPGDAEGNNIISFLRPPGSTLSSDSCRFGPSGGILAVASPCQIDASNRKYNGTWLTVQIDLSGYTCSTNCWWKVKYHYDNQAHDRTTWSASILESPVHLVPNG